MAQDIIPGRNRRGGGAALVLLDLGSCNFKVVCVYRAVVHKGSIRAVYAGAINVPSYTGCVCLFTAYVYIVYTHRKKREREKREEKSLHPRSSQFLAFKLYCNTTAHERIAWTSRSKTKKKSAIYRVGNFETECDAHHYRSKLSSSILRWHRFS